ncbi:DUF2231 domain-containing protein [Ancylomarina longa]|uniref:DUF2231 domain-containing protein n=1 Tax=Ancylomarina longa TaxID=2487017 RepID=A0A434AYF4_9BACT|nr:DUF2231 domain-containing protein [Ancylomarina longa]RUT79599.1 DUF2231 domain-containing protein [Ancylomarina longa]
MIPIHPRIVHFPLALFMIAALVGIIALLSPSRRNLLKEILLWNLGFGLLGAVLAIITGYYEESVLVHNEAIHELMETHELLGIIFTSLFLVSFVWMLIRKSKMGKIEFISIVLFLIFSSGILAYSAHLGGKMVYENGAGVVPMKKIIKDNSKDTHEHEEHNHTHEH